MTPRMFVPSSMSAYPSLMFSNEYVVVIISSIFSRPDLYRPTSFGVSTCELPPPKMLPFNVFCNMVNRNRLSWTSTSIIEPMPVTTQVPVTGLHLGDVGGRSETGRHRTAHDGGGFERDVLIDLDDRVL